MGTASGNIRLSLSMIVKNEERFLEGCLRSVEEVVDDMVIVDTGSTDRTVEIARTFDAVVIPYAWTNDFSAARNESLKHATGEWILYLDADERLASGQAEALRSLIQDGGAGGFRLIIRSEYQLPSGVIHQLNPYPRLFRRHPSIRFEGKIHEQIGPSIDRLGLKIFPSEIVIDHLGYAQGEEIVRQKCLRNMELISEELERHPDDWYAHFQLGNTLMVLQRYDEAEPSLNKALAFHDVPPGIRAIIYNLLAEIAVRRGNCDDAIDHCRESLRYAPEQLMARWFTAAAHITAGNAVDAVRQLNSVLDLVVHAGEQRITDIAYDITVTPEEILSHIGCCHERSGEYDEAAQSFIRALQKNNRSIEGLRGIARIHGYLKDQKSVIAHVEAMGDETAPNAELHTTLATMYRTIGDVEAAMTHLRRVIAIDPKNARVRALEAQWSLEDGNITRAEELLRWAAVNDVMSYDIDKASLDLALRTRNIPQALHYLDKMISMVPPENISLKNRLANIAAKLTSRSGVM